MTDKGKSEGIHPSGCFHSFLTWSLLHKSSIDRPMRLRRRLLACERSWRWSFHFSTNSLLLWITVSAKCLKCDGAYTLTEAARLSARCQREGGRYCQSCSKHQNLMVFFYDDKHAQCPSYTSGKVTACRISLDGGEAYDTKCCTVHQNKIPKSKLRPRIWLKIVKIMRCWVKIRIKSKVWIWIRTQWGKITRSSFLILRQQYDIFTLYL